MSQHTAFLQGQRVVCITGMERSGTSLVARLANLLGVYLGPAEHLVLEVDYNPKGCWEHEQLLQLNNEMLLALGGDTYAPPDFAGRWRTMPGLEQYQERAYAILRADFADQQLWGWKDTRNCLTLPFWQSIIPNLAHIICIRNPKDVATSMQKLGWMTSVDRSQGLWVEYTATALRHTAGAPRLVLLYEDLMADWRRAFERIAEFLGRPDAARDEVALREAAAFVSSDLHHYQTDLVALFDDASIPFEAKALFTQLKSATSSSLSEQELDRFAQLSLDGLHSSRAAARRLAELTDELHQQSAREATLGAELAATSRAYEQALAALQGELVASRTRADNAQRCIEELRTREALLQETLESERRILDALRHEVRWVAAIGENWKALAQTRGALLRRLGEPDSLQALSRVIDVGSDHV